MWAAAAASSTQRVGHRQLELAAQGGQPEEHVENYLLFPPSPTKAQPKPRVNLETSAASLFHNLLRGRVPATAQVSELSNNPRLVPARTPNTKR